MRSRPLAATRRAVRHLCGRHSLQVSLGSAVSGEWLWSVDCVCLRESRSWAQGSGDTRAAAHAAALAAVREVDELAAVRHVFGEPAVPIWREPSLAVQAGQIELPARLRGRGHVLVAGHARRYEDLHTGWAAVTDAGWHQRGQVFFDDWSARSLAALAIGRGLLFYPRGHLVDVLTGNLDAAHMTRRILAGRVTSWLDAPGWLPREAFTALHKAAHRHLVVRVIEVNDHALQPIANRLAARLPLADLLRPKEDT
ncbi:hypothetical protein [Lentzea sp. NPDC059081]|uniref:hypothetical protein n=1 Tax=Lentzea sp. NPDC059081 TaxID=3346719 RepID=UPI00369F2D7F